MTAKILRPTISKNNSGPLRLNSEVRSKFFTRIGVVGADLNTCMHQFENADISKDTSAPTRDLQNVPRYSSKLKRDKCDEKELQAFLERRRRYLSRRAAYEARARALDKNSTPEAPEPIPKEKESKPKRCISFNESVKVVPIPTRHEYSDRIRSRLWTNTVELYENAARNHVEFAAEGYDWRSACDDEQMYLCRKTGEKIHPVHYEMLTDPLLDANHDASEFVRPTAKIEYWAAQDVI